MTRKVIWSRQGLADLGEQAAFIATENADAALRVVASIRKTGDGLGKHNTGRPGRNFGTYEKSVAKYPFVIVYQIARSGEDETVFVLRVIHTARDWPKGGWPKG